MDNFSTQRDSFMKAALESGKTLEALNSKFWGNFSKTQTAFCEGALETAKQWACNFERLAAKSPTCSLRLARTIRAGSKKAFSFLPHRPRPSWSSRWWSVRRLNSALRKIFETVSSLPLSRLTSPLPSSIGLPAGLRGCFFLAQSHPALPFAPHQDGPFYAALRRSSHCAIVRATKVRAAPT